MSIQQLIAGAGGANQNSLMEMDAKIQAIRNYESANALNEAKARELPYERERAAALNDAKVGKEGALTEQAKAGTQKTQTEISFDVVEWVLRNSANKPAVLGALRHGAQHVPEMGQAADYLERLDGPAFAQAATKTAMTVKDKIEQERKQESTDSQIAYRDSMLGKPMVVQTPGGAYTYDPQNPAGGAAPVPGIPDPNSTAAIREADKVWLKEQDKAGVAAENLSNSIEQAKALLSSPASVLGSGPMDRAAYGLHQLGVNNSEAAVNTERLREIGASMTLSFGSLGSQVSNADRETYQRAQGDFESAKSVQAMLLSLKTMAEVAQRAMDKVNQNRATYEQTGRKPDFAPARPYGDPNVPPPPVMEPGMDSGTTREQDLAEARRRGLIK